MRDLWLWVWMSSRAQGHWSSTKEMKFAVWRLGVRTYFRMQAADYGHQCPMPRQHLNTKIWDISLHRRDAWHPQYLQMAWCAEIAFGIKLNVVKTKLLICPLRLRCRIIPLCCLEAQLTVCYSAAEERKLSSLSTAQTCGGLLPPRSIAPSIWNTEEFAWSTPSTLVQDGWKINSTELKLLDGSA